MDLTIMILVFKSETKFHIFDAFKLYWHYPKIYFDTFHKYATEMDMETKKKSFGICMECTYKNRF